MNEIITAISHTPFWVYGVFAVLIFFGWMQIRSRIVSAKRAFITPIIMLCLSLYGIISSFGFNFAVIAWMAGVLMSALIGRRLNLIVKMPSNLFFIKGSPLPLALMIAIFILKYIVEYTAARDLDIADSSLFIYICNFGFGALSGVFVGMILNLKNSSICNNKQ